MKANKIYKIGRPTLVFIFVHLLITTSWAQQDIPNSFYVGKTFYGSNHRTKAISFRGDHKVKFGYIHNRTTKTDVRTYTTAVLDNDNHGHEYFFQNLDGFSIGPDASQASGSWFELNNSMAFFRHKVGIGTPTPDKGNLQVRGSLHVESTEEIDADGNPSVGGGNHRTVFHVTAGGNADGNKGRVFVGDSAYHMYTHLLDNNNYDDSNLKTQDFRLWVSQGIAAEDLVIIGKANWADYVFKKGYDLRELTELEAYIQANGHLPNVPSEEEVRHHGYGIHEIATSYLEKIEELTLYTIAQEKKLNDSKAAYAALLKRVEALENTR